MIIRLSRTEPKLKFYIVVKGNNEYESDAKVAVIKASINKVLNKLI